MKKNPIHSLFVFLYAIFAVVSSSAYQDNADDLFDERITIDGRTYKISPDFEIPSGIDKDSPVKLNFTDDTHELQSIERLIEDDSNSNELEYHFGIVNAITRANTDLEYRVYYLEMLPGLLLFIPIGCITWGMTDCLAGLLAGICVGSILAVTEWIFFRRVSYGGGDTVYGAMASALIGYSNFCLYWGCFTLILVLAAAVHVILVKAVRKQKLSDNRFVPLLPWFSILTTVLYEVQIINI